MTGSSWSGRRVLVHGLGLFGGGVGAARYLARLGAEVTVTDLRSATALAESLALLSDVEHRAVLGEHRTEDFDAAELIVANPAVRPDHPLLARARARGARITTEIELFLEAVRARVVAVTGTQGKSSTVHLTAGLLEHLGYRTHVGGNIGGSLLSELEEIRATDVVVLELSSYQLELLPQSGLPQAEVNVRCAEAIAITNVLEDHLERHGTRAAYARAKRRIFELLRPDGVALVPSEGDGLGSWELEGARLLAFADRSARPDAPESEERGPERLSARDDAFWLDGERLAGFDDLHLPGRFQRKNALVALGLARLLGAEAGRLPQALAAQRGLEHRLEPLGTRAGRRIYDNGVSTTPDSTVAALEALDPGVSVLLGGRAKKLSLESLVTCLRTREARVFTFGQDGATLAGACRSGGVEAHGFSTLEQAVEAALAQTPPGRALLFSPACASFDAYPNFRARALAFRALLPPRDP